MGGRLKARPRLVQTVNGHVTVANVQYGRERPLARWNREAGPTFIGCRTKEDVLAEIDRFRAEIAEQDVLMPYEYDESPRQR